MPGPPRPGARLGAMRIGLFLGAGVPPNTPELLAAIARHADELGIETLWLGEHVVLFDEHDRNYPYASTGDFPIKGEAGMAEPFTTLAFLAGITRSVRLGTAVCLVPQRNPLYTAKEVANVDWLSGGRFDFGIGVGWQHEEFEALKVPFADRGRRNDEYIALMRTLWCDPVSSFQGEFWDLAPCRAYPKPVQDPHPPIHIGGESDIALRRVVRLDAHWFPFNLDPAGLAARRDRLAALLADAGDRTIDDVTITVSPARDLAGAEHRNAFEDAGADQLIARLPRDLTMATVEQAFADLARDYRLG